MSDDLLAAAEWVRVETSLALSADAQSSRGQYFTPERAASLIASLPRVPDADRIRVLDPGAGSGMLTAAIVARLLADAPGRHIKVTSVEVDAALIPALQRTAKLCEQWARNRSADVSIDVVQGDVIALSTGLEARWEASFDLVIMNPPYKKLGAFSPERHALASLGWNATNFNTAFLSIGVEALKPGGQLVAITPRSFANGPYYGLFRKVFLRQVAIDRLHVFESRSSVFADSGVLQENIIFSCTKGGVRGLVTIIFSRDHEGVPNEKGCAVFASCGTD